MGVRVFCNRDGHDGIIAQCVDYGYSVVTQSCGVVGPIGPRFEDLVLRSSQVYGSSGVLLMTVTERYAGHIDVTDSSDYVCDIRVEIDVPYGEGGFGPQPH